MNRMNNKARAALANDLAMLMARHNANSGDLISLIAEAAADASNELPDTITREQKRTVLAALSSLVHCATLTRYAHRDLEENGRDVSASLLVVAATYSR